MTDTPTAAVLIIGNEVLSGRTRDANLGWLGERLGRLGIPIIEARVVRDDEAAVIAALDALRATYTYVFTTGGIGPTHDDITSACVAKAFGVPLVRHPDALAALQKHYADADMTPGRLKMTDVPEGATLITNPVSSAPGFRIGNVFVLAGVPRIMQAMVDGIAHDLVGGPPVLSGSVTARIGEGVLAGPLGEIQASYPDVELGSYPYFRFGQFGVSVVARGTDQAAIDAALAAVAHAMEDLGGTLVEAPPPEDP